MSGIIVHEWLEKHGGAEKVLDELLESFPTASVKCLWNDDPTRYEEKSVSETWLAKTPLRKNKRLALAFMPSTWRHLGDATADWILCSSHLFAHHARFSGAAAEAPKYVYAHTPARYIWTPDLDSRGRGLIAQTASIPLRSLDKHRIKEATAVASNSQFVKERIESTWERDAVVIYPPVDVAAFAVDTAMELSPTDEAALYNLPSEFILGASRFIPYKQLDEVIRAGRTSNIHVVLAGSGPSGHALRALAAEQPGQVTFIDQPSRSMLRELYKRALAYIFPPVEDFGIMPVEAMATGTPVVARNLGGAAETVVNGVTGILVESFDGSEIRNAIYAAASLRGAECTRRAWEFDKSVFRTEIKNWVTG
ncbi:glycosyltransferase [Arthrobacter crystallopoietes]|uniref:D-inositol 3-phosphate glycosyltransferase n=1 Tax=Crystallibacter crystallopoietes TaxID=37928 RepID=A0A1H0ZRN3_9MICC|nr:glycosyltransferase [Arthrobacter crystallopoietes]AUI51856.1 hypothetical protein AC20117_14725 [Arthrobacter crystallopoietes]SDQ29881.1 Glycosyltransferase involved in cell wall bisynthesis [Arthrobacter crystallopoietes]